MCGKNEGREGRKEKERNICKDERKGGRRRGEIVTVKQASHRPFIRKAVFHDVEGAFLYKQCYCFYAVTDACDVRRSCDQDTRTQR